MPIFINLTNHNSAAWPMAQKEAATAIGALIDMAFPSIDPYADSKEIDLMVDEYFNRVMAYKNPKVLLMGEFIFTFRLVTRLKAAGIHVYATCSERKAIEYTDPEGKVQKRSVFDFVTFKEY